MTKLYDRFISVPWSDLSKIQSDLAEFFYAIEKEVKNLGYDFNFYGDSSDISETGFSGSLSYDKGSNFWGSYRLDRPVTILNETPEEVAAGIVKEWEQNTKEETLKHERWKREQEEKNDKRKAIWVLRQNNIAPDIVDAIEKELWKDYVEPQKDTIKQEDELKPPPIVESDKYPYIYFDVYRINADGSRSYLYTTDFEEDLIKIGKGNAATLKIDHDDAVALMHCYVQLNGKEDAFVNDVCSKTGTFLNKQRIEQKQKIVAGDEIMIGNTAIFVRSLNVSK
jgi:hypothetical protein